MLRSLVRVCGATGLLAALLLAWPVFGASEALPIVRVSLPGPRNLSYLPLELIAKIGADRAEGVRLQLHYVGGGAVALHQLLKKNVDFASAGVPAMLSQQLHGDDVVLLAAVDDLPLLVLMVRSDLRREVRSPADLRGRVIGANTSSLTSKTTSQQMTELLLAAAKVSPEEVRIVPVGQSWEEHSAVLLAKTVDAIMCNEPVASRLEGQGLASPLVNLADPQVARSVPGSGFLYAALATRQEILDREPQKARRMVAMLQRTLRWMADHSADEIVAALAVDDRAEADALRHTLQRYPRLFSPDGRLSSRQLKETETFFHSTAGEMAAREVRIESLVDDRVAGRKE